MTTMPLRLTAKEKEQVGDARLLLDSAAHNLRSAQGDEAVQSLINAEELATQALQAIRRIRESIAGRN